MDVVGTGQDDGGVMSCMDVVLSPFTIPGGMTLEES